jgi:hypothetical protein
MLEDLPEIFERKFRQRVQGLIEEQRRLLLDNQILRDRLYALTPTTSTAVLAPARNDARPQPRSGLREALGNLLRLPGTTASPRQPRLSPADDERTRAA